jgi:hypothetical protein
MSASETTAAPTAAPVMHTVEDHRGRPCYAADAQGACYPLRAWCANCGHRITCADATAAWVHTLTRRGGCHWRAVMNHDAGRGRA